MVSAKKSVQVFGGRKVSCLFPLLALISVSAIGFVSTWLTAPGTFAKANACLGGQANGLRWRNTCQHDINVQYCLFSKAGEEKDFCRDLSLTPGEGVSDQQLKADLTDLEGLLRLEIMACKAPFLPGQKIDSNNKRLKPACLSEGDALVGPHVSRSPYNYLK